MTRSFRHLWKASRLGAAVMGCALIAPAVSLAQEPCGCSQAYRIVYKTVYDQEPVTTYRLQYETQLVERPITVQKPVWETEVRVRKYTVAKPVTETSERVEQVTVMKPVWETSEREYAYDKVTYVTETQNRVERYTTLKPVYQQHEREEQYTVRKAVQEQVMQPQQHTVYEPVTTMATQYVDQGGYVDQTYCTPGAVTNRLQWVPGGSSVSAVNGLPYYHRGGLHWVPQQAAAVTTTARVYVPNIVAQQVPQTQMVAKVVTTEVPVQVTRYVDEVQTRRVPYQTLSYQEEVHERQVPVTVQKPVVERVVERQPIRTCKWVQETQERRTPVTVQRMEYEEREEQIPVKVCKMVTEQRVVQETRTVAKWVATEQTRMTPRVVAMRVPVDACGGISPTYMPSTTTQRVIIDPVPRVENRVEVQRQATPPAPPMPSAPTEAERPMADDATNGTPDEDEAMSDEERATSGDSIQREPASKIVPRDPTKNEATDKDETGRPMLNGPNPAKRTPAPEDNEA